MKKNGLKIVSVSLLVIFALIIVSLVSYIFELQDKLNIMKNELARREIKEDEENIVSENVLEESIVSENEDSLKKVTGKTRKFLNLTSDYEVLEDENGVYAGWETELMDGCGWWCTVMDVNEDVKASSTLKNDKHINYLPKNVFEKERNNSWVEGAQGNGIGEWIELEKQYLCYEGDEDGGRLGEICIVTGYANNEKLWKENSRVKTLLMYVDGTPYAYLELEDTIQPQFFNVWENDTFELKPSQEFKLKFEIVEVYEGTKYEDTAITYLDVQFLKGH